MFDITTLPIFFLGANTSHGYVSRFADSFDSKTGWRAWIIKGGPGTGKSSFMKRLAAAVAQKGERVELITCTADPNSLDGVICPDRKLTVLDGTSPHTIDPDFPGISGRIINTGMFWDEEKLEQDRYKIMALAEQNSRLHKRAAGYMAAAASLASDSCRIATAATDTEKLKKFGKSLALKYIPDNGGKGREQIRFLSGITPAGVTYYRSTVEKMCDRVIEICDENGAAAPVILDCVRKTAVERGHGIITCRCPLHPLDKTEHVIIPELKLAFCTVNRFLAPVGENRRIHARRFEDLSAMRAHKQRLAFNRRAVRELLDGAAEILTEAKQVHDLLEQYYVNCMDFPALEAYCRNILNVL